MIIMSYVAVTSRNKVVPEEAIKLLTIDLFIVLMHFLHFRQIAKTAAPFDKIVIATHEVIHGDDRDDGFPKG